MMVMMVEKIRIKEYFMINLFEGYNLIVGDSHRRIYLSSPILDAFLNKVLNDDDIPDQRAS